MKWVVEKEEEQAEKEPWVSFPKIAGMNENLVATNIFALTGEKCKKVKDYGKEFLVCMPGIFAAEKLLGMNGQKIRGTIEILQIRKVEQHMGVDEIFRFVKWKLGVAEKAEKMQELMAPTIRPSRAVRKVEKNPRNNEKEVQEENKQEVKVPKKEICDAKKIGDDKKNENLLQENFGDQKKADQVPNCVTQPNSQYYPQYYGGDGWRWYPSPKFTFYYSGKPCGWYPYGCQYDPKKKASAEILDMGTQMIGSGAWDRLEMKREENMHGDGEKVG